jgi:hypothetical protein
MSWNYNYGAFSEVIHDGAYDSKMTLLKNPKTMETDAYTMFASALWQYMTPQITMSPNWSTHDVVTGFAYVNLDDKSGKQVLPIDEFGTTTSIITNGEACGKQKETKESKDRIE